MGFALPLRQPASQYFELVPPFLMAISFLCGGSLLILHPNWVHSHSLHLHERRTRGKITLLPPQSSKEI
jgi:hypothetical protein